MNHIIELKDINNTNFWLGYFRISYPNAYDEENDQSIHDILDDFLTDEQLKWWEHFTGYFDGILDENDGYLESPATLEVSLNPDETLTIEFHPCDTIYFINGLQIGNTGPHYTLQVLPYNKLKQVLLENGNELFFLLLPLAFVKEEETNSATQQICSLMTRYFPKHLCESLSKCIVCGMSDNN